MDNHVSSYQPGFPSLHHGSSSQEPPQTLANTGLFGLCLPTVPSAHGLSSAAHLPLGLGTCGFFFFLSCLGNPKHDRIHKDLNSKSPFCSPLWLPLGESVPHPHSSLSNLEKMTGEGCVVSLYCGETQAGLQKDFTKSQKEEEAPGWESHHTQLPWGRMLSWHPGKQADESFHRSAIRGSSRFQFSQLRPAPSPADF